VCKNVNGDYYVTSRYEEKIVEHSNGPITLGRRMAAWETGVLMACLQMRWKTTNDTRMCSRGLGAG
jgi:rhamnogalacturonyl hydrolase YesR